MENLSTAYDAIDLLTSLGLPISSEQLQQVKDLEQQYIYFTSRTLVWIDVRCFSSTSTSKISTRRFC